MTELEWLDIFGDNLRDLMEERGYSQRELATLCGLSESVVSNYVNKRSMPGVRAIINMSYELGVDVNEFIDFDDRIE